MIVKKRSIETIKRALDLYLNIKSALSRCADESVAKKAVSAIQDGIDAKNDLDRLLSSFGAGQTEDGVEVLFYL